MPFGFSLRLAAGVACVAGFPLVGAACSSSPKAAGGAPVIEVTEHDFQISTPPHLQAGDVIFRVHNEGPDDHEFIVVRLGQRPIPLRADGMTVNEEALAQAEVASLEPGPPGSFRSLPLHLAPGRYMALCNMEGHYMGGMHQIFTVS
jgi:uncharacterized cupredoxin-like copper-binding protein